jgi:hypothetical protein
MQTVPTSSWRSSGATARVPSTKTSPCRASTIGLTRGSTDASAGFVDRLEMVDDLCDDSRFDKLVGVSQRELRKTHESAGLAPPSVVIERAGARIGILGVTTEQTLSDSFPEHPPVEEGARRDIGRGIEGEDQHLRDAL